MVANGPFRSSVLFVPSRERSLPGAKTRGTFAPASFHSRELDRELSLPRIFRSLLKRTFAPEVQCVITLFVYGDYARGNEGIRHFHLIYSDNAISSY